MRLATVLAILAAASAAEEKTTGLWTETTTITPWDSSSGNSGDSSDSLTSESLNDESSSSVDPSDSAHSWGWKQAGSSGSNMNNYLWLLALALCCLAALVP